MPTFTLELREVIRLTKNHIGLDNYPIFNPEYRNPLNQKIVDHYFLREIGHETIDHFQFALRRKMQEIMPLYNKLYLTEQVEYDPLSTIDIRTLTDTVGTQNTVGSSESGSTSESNSNSRSIDSAFPQTMLNANGDYATGGADAVSKGVADSSANESNNSESNADQTSDSRVSGYQGVASELIMRYRESLLNIDMMVINELEELFMGIWNIGDSYTNGGYFE